MLRVSRPDVPGELADAPEPTALVALGVLVVRRARLLDLGHGCAVTIDVYGSSFFYQGIDTVRLNTSVAGGPGVTGA